MSQANLLLVGKIIRKDKIELDLNKIEKHDVIPRGLELHLTDFGHKISASIHLEGYSNRVYSIKNFKSIEQAKREYSDMLIKFRKDLYKIHCYSNGEVEVEFL